MLRLVGKFPEYLDSFNRAYVYKSTSPGRRQFQELMTQQPGKLLNELKALTRDFSDLVDTIWGEIMFTLQSDNSQVPTNISHWKERNDEIYTKFLMEYLKFNQPVRKD